MSLRPGNGITHVATRAFEAAHCTVQLRFKDAAQNNGLLTEITSQHTLTKAESEAVVPIETSKPSSVVELEDLCCGISCLQALTHTAVAILG
jgi:hypothetical protein